MTPRMNWDRVRWDKKIEAAKGKARLQREADERARRLAAQDPVKSSDQIADEIWQRLADEQGRTVEELKAEARARRGQ